MLSLASLGLSLASLGLGAFSIEPEHSDAELRAGAQRRRALKLLRMAAILAAEGRFAFDEDRILPAANRTDGLFLVLVDLRTTTFGDVEGDFLHPSLTERALIHRIPLQHCSRRLA
jgi:hypothetical protein